MKLRCSDWPSCMPYMYRTVKLRLLPISVILSKNAFEAAVHSTGAYKLLMRSLTIPGMSQQQLIMLLHHKGRF